MKKISTQCLGEKDASYTDFMEESKIFIAHCYGMTEVISSTNMFDKKIQSFFCIVFKIKSSLSSFLVVVMPKEKESKL